ncbi:MAG: phosphocarrier protein HPr [Halobaculum sp.]
MERTVTVVPEAGLHARPASQFVQRAGEFECDVRIEPVDSGEAVDAQSMLAVTGLNVGAGEQVRLIADGEDAEAALDALEAVLTTPENGGESA